MNLKFPDEVDAYTAYKAHGAFTPHPGKPTCGGRNREFYSGIFVRMLKAGGASIAMVKRTLKSSKVDYIYDVIIRQYTDVM